MSRPYSAARESMNAASRALDPLEPYVSVSERLCESEPDALLSSESLHAKWEEQIEINSAVDERDDICERDWR